jgi:hypothetical protein
LHVSGQDDAVRPGVVAVEVISMIVTKSTRLLASTVAEYVADLEYYLNRRPKMELHATAFALLPIGPAPMLVIVPVFVRVPEAA